MTTCLNHRRFYVLISCPGCLWLRWYQYRFHKVIVLWYHSTAVLRPSWWISHIGRALLSGILITLSWHSPWADAAARVVLVYRFHILGNNVIFRLILRSMCSWLSSKTWVRLSAWMILLIDVSIKSVVMRSGSSEAIDVIKRYLRLVKHLGRACGSSILMIAKIERFLFLNFRGWGLMDIVRIVAALAYHI